MLGELSELRKRKLDNQFRLLDTDGDGRVGRADFEAVATRLCARLCVDLGGAQARELHERQAALFDQLGVREDEWLSAEGYRRLFADSGASGGDGDGDGGAGSPTDELGKVVGLLARSVVELCAREGDDELGHTEFRAFLTAWGLPDDDADSAFDHLDIDGSGTISVDELAEALTEFYTSDDPYAPGNWLFGPPEEEGVSQARLPYPDTALLPTATRELLAGMPQLNVFRMLAHAHSLFPALIGVGKAMYAELALPGDLRVLAILQVAQELDGTYVWTQQISAAQAVGIPRPKIIAVRDGRTKAACLSETEQAALTFTAEVMRRNRASDAAFERLRRRLTPQQIVELIVVTGWYAALCRLTSALALDAERSQGDKVHAYVHGD